MSVAPAGRATTPLEWAACWVFRTNIEGRVSQLEQQQPGLANFLLDLLAVRCFGCGSTVSGEGRYVELCETCRGRRQWQRN